MPKLPHHHAHYPDKKAGVSRCRCGDTVKLPTEPVKPPPTLRAGYRKTVTWEGIRGAVKPLVADNAHDITAAVIEYLLGCGVEVAPPF